MNWQTEQPCNTFVASGTGGNEHTSQVIKSIMFTISHPHSPQELVINISHTCDNFFPSFVIHRPESDLWSHPPTHHILMFMISSTHTSHINVYDLIHPHTSHINVYDLIRPHTSHINVYDLICPHTSHINVYATHDAVHTNINVSIAMMFCTHWLGSIGPTSRRNMLSDDGHPRLGRRRTRIPVLCNPVP